MSRSGYTEDLEDLAMGRWRGQVASAIRGKRGQKLLRDLLAALDAMPEKALITHELRTEEGEVCALGALAVARGIDISKIDPSEPEEVGVAFDVAPQLAQEIVYMNDEHFDFRYENQRCVPYTSEERWKAMRAWLVGKIR